MDAKKVYLLIGIVIVIGLLPQTTAFADMGPKPSFQFQFVQDTVGSDLILETWNLISCPDSECKDSNGILEISGDDFTCEDNTCRAVLNPLQYQGNSYFQIEATFSDNKLRRSNIFEKSYFDTKFKVTILDDALLVDELEGNNPSLLSDPLSLIFLSPLLIPVGCIILIVGYFVLVVVSNHLRITDEDGVTKSPIKKTLPPLLVFATFFVFLGLLLNVFTFLFTLAIEGILAIAYLKYINVSGKKTLMGVILANVFTQPSFVIASNIFANNMTSVLILEIIIWLVESWIVNKVQVNQLPFKTILMLTFILNAASFGIGLLLPI
jgi:hypothetical protein